MAQTMMIGRRASEPDDDVAGTGSARGFADWPIAGAGEGCNAFLAALGIEDALIAYSAPTQATRSLFLVGLAPLRRHADQLRLLVQAAERLWSPFPDRRVDIVDLSAAADALVIGGGYEDRLLIGTPSSPLDPFGEAIVAQQSTAKGCVKLLLLRRRDRGRLDASTLELRNAALPLFLDAVTSFCAARWSEQRSAMVRAMLDHVSLPTLLVDERGRPLMLNRASVELLRRRETLLHGADGTIEARSPRESRLLRASIQAACGAAHCNDGSTQAVRLSDKEGNWLLAVVVPARPTEPEAAGPGAMIVIHEPRANGAPQYILSALGLLPSEQRFMDAFLRSDSLSEAAARSKLSQETARTYLKRVRSKLGAHRQMDLARMIYGLVPPISAGQIDAQAVEA